MAKKAKHEDHINHEAWAIPYGDLITLLLAFFVVMYSMSSVNEGKYRVLADSLNAAFKGSPRSPSPIQIGPKSPTGGESSEQRSIVPGSSSAVNKPQIVPMLSKSAASETKTGSAEAAAQRQRKLLRQMSEKVQEALGGLISQRLVVVKRTDEWLEIEVQAELLYPSGSARLGDSAAAILKKLANVLQEFDNPLRIQGHTDNRPISTREFPSNWELSSARAASVVHSFMQAGIEPSRMQVLGMAEYKPIADNKTAEGRNRNRRVVILVLADPQGDQPESGSEMTAEAEAEPELKAPKASTSASDPEAAPNARPLVSAVKAAPTDRAANQKRAES